MDTHSTHLTAPGRTRSSQSPSPSHSASASVTSTVHKRKLDPPLLPPPSSISDTRDGGLTTSNDDLDSISARGDEANEDSDDDDSNDNAAPDEEEEDEFDNESMRNFTAARLDKKAVVAPVRNSKLKKETLIVKIEPDLVKDGGNVGLGAAVTAAGSVPGIVVKEDSSKIFTENIQNSGAYSAREESLKREEEAGRVKFVCLANDGVDEHMVWLIGLKNIFSRQLPNMPKEYIVRLVMDRSHKSVMVIRENHVVGGITFRPYAGQKFGEIAFCAITADEQVKGYGTRLMNHLKQHARDVDGLTHFLTYADNNAVGYFIKQGFTKEIFLDKEQWQGYIKDYDGGILMECRINPKLPYTDLSTMIRRQRQAIDEKIKELSNCHIVYPGIDFQKFSSQSFQIVIIPRNTGMITLCEDTCNPSADQIKFSPQKEAGIPKKLPKVEDIPGLKEAGWTLDQWGHSRFKSINASTDSVSNQKSLTVFMRSLLKSVHDHPDAWPFKEPVDGRDVPDYYEIIKDPMDLKTMSKRVESEQYYVTFEMFVADVKRMFSNARTYNSPETIYYKCSTRLEAHFSSKVHSGLQSSNKIQH